jgi:hypothetical protein
VFYNEFKNVKIKVPFHGKYNLVPADIFTENKTWHLGGRFDCEDDS